MNIRFNLAKFEVHILKIFKLFINKINKKTIKKMMKLILNNGNERFRFSTRGATSVAVKNKG